MGEFLGAVAGLMMLVLVGLLLGRFLVQAGAQKPGTARRLGRAALLLGTAMGLNFGCAALLRSVIYGLTDITRLDAVFSAASVQRALAALKSPAWDGPLSGLMAYLGHALGSVFLGRYVLGGLLLSFGVSWAACALILARGERLSSAARAERALFLLLCAPGAIFCLLPGWWCLALLGGALLFYFLGERLPAFSWKMPDGLYAALLALAGMLSALLAYGLVSGRAG